MKRFIKSALFMILGVLILCSSLFMASAEGETATINGQQIKVGDTVTYTFNVSDADQKVTGMQINIFFDQDALELQEVTDGVLNGSSTINDNQNKDGRIVLVNAFMNGGGLACKEKTALATATFKVKAAVETEITYFVQYLYDIDMVDIYSYTFTCDLTSGDVVISEDKTPILADGTVTDKITEVDNFRNNQEGKGDGIKREPVTVNNTPSNNTVNTPQTQTQQGGDNNNNSSNTAIIVAIGGVAIVAVAVVLIMVLKPKSHQ